MIFSSYQSPAYAGSSFPSNEARKHMVEQLREHGITSEPVLKVMGDIPRHEFVDEAVASHAYQNASLPIGFSQTISQPYIVARMTELLLAGASRVDSVLEIGTGCGYQAAVLSKLSRQVYTIERIKGLLEQARQRFRRYHMNNIRAKFDDGQEGWAVYGPFSGIMLTAAASEIPENLAKQLALGGVMVFPLQRPKGQVLVRAIREEEGISLQEIAPVQFVPIITGKASQ